MEYAFTRLPEPGSVVHVKWTPFMRMSASPMHPVRGFQRGPVTPMVLELSFQPDSTHPMTDSPSPAPAVAFVRPV